MSRLMYCDCRAFSNRLPDAKMPLYFCRLRPSRRPASQRRQHALSRGLLLMPRAADIEALRLVARFCSRL